MIYSHQHFSDYRHSLLIAEPGRGSLKRCTFYVIEREFLNMRYCPDKQT